MSKKTSRSGSTRQPKGPSQEQLERERDWDGTKFKSTGTTVRQAKKNRKSKSSNDSRYGDPKGGHESKNLPVAKKRKKKNSMKIRNA